MFFHKLPSMEAEIDCGLQSNSSWAVYTNVAAVNNP